jgi:hypothetical protein
VLGYRTKRTEYSMSNHFNAKAFESIDKITDALIATLEELPQPLVQTGHLLHRAVDDFAEACYLYRHGGIELAEDDFRRCKRSLKTALELLMAAFITDHAHQTDEGSVPNIDEWCEDDDDDAASYNSVYASPYGDRATFYAEMG